MRSAALSRSSTTAAMTDCGCISSRGVALSFVHVLSHAFARKIAKHCKAGKKPLAKTVATMEPIVAGYAVTRWKISGAFALGTCIIAAIGWIISLFAGKIVVWIVSFFR